MTAFRVLLVALWVGLIGYTVVVADRFGIGLFHIFFGDIARVSWPGQFNVDFTCFLVLSALWTAWRNGFSGIGLALAPVAFVGGASFLLPYLLYLSVKERREPAAMLLGVHARR